MEYYKVFTEVLLKEIEKFKLDPDVYSTYVTQLTASLAENFDVPYYRCAYMFRYAPANIYFFNDCIKKFLLEYSNIKDIFSLWKSYSEVKVCSLSVGPGLDYLGFLLAVLEYDPFPPNFNGVKIVSKHGAWRNTVNLILEVFRKHGTVFEVAWSNLKYENVNVIQADLWQSYADNRINVPVSEANVILMMKTLNLVAAGTTQEGHMLHMLKELIGSLKSEAIIFCIDTKPSIALLTQALSHYPGKFLYGPIHETVKLPCNFPEIAGSHPIISIRGAFFSWQKLSTSPPWNLCTTPLENTSVDIENKSNLQAASSSDYKLNSSTVENEAKVEDKDSDSNSNHPWIELKTFWKCSSPKTKELLKRLMLTNEESLGQLNDLISQSEKSDIDKKNPLSIPQTAMLQDIESSGVQKIPLNITQTATLEDIKLIPIVSPNQMQDLSVNSLKSTHNNCSNIQNALHEDNSCDSVGSLSRSDTLNSVSSFTCENDSSSGRIEGRSTGTILKTGETLLSYHAGVKNNPTKMNSGGDTIKKVISAESSYCENKIIQTDTHQDNPIGSSSVKELTERIRQLAISLESVSQQNETCDGGDFNEPRNCHTEGRHNCTSHSIACTTDKPSCSKQSSNCGFKNQDSLPSYESEAEKEAPFQNMDCHYRCQCCHNRYHMNCCLRSCNFQPCCVPQSFRRCDFSCNRQQSIEHNFENFSSPTIVIPVQHISNDALLKIVSVLKSESKN